MGYTLVQAQAFLDAEARHHREELARMLVVVAVAAQGERRSVEQLQRELLADPSCD
jgi:hypothetical protein